MFSLLQAHPAAIAYVLAVAAAAAPPSGTVEERACRPKFDGDAFLVAASQRGLEPQRKSECHKVSISDNTFHAMPQASCDLFFENATWLAGSARFQKVSGQGSFTAQVKDDGVEVKIKPRGGFYVTQVTIAVTGPFSSCDDVSVEDVLGGG